MSKKQQIEFQIFFAKINSLLRTLLIQYHLS